MWWAQWNHRYPFKRQVGISAPVSLFGSARCCSVLWTLAALASLDSQFSCLLSSARPWALTGSPFLYQGLENFSRQEAGGHCRHHFICFPSLWGDCPVLPVIQCLKTSVSCILAIFPVISGERVNLVSLGPFCLEVEVFLFFPQIIFNEWLNYNLFKKCLLFVTAEWFSLYWRGISYLTGSLWFDIWVKF